MAAPRNLPKQQKYGLLWEPLMLDAAIEMQMIRQGGKYKGQGNGLFFHFKAFISLLWPDHTWHRWGELALKTYLENKIVGVMGPASSGKSHDAALYILADFYVWSDCTTVLVSSTEREMLEMRIWGEIKKYHRMAKERFPELIPGNLIESRQRIITDNRFENVEGRDFRNGLAGIPLKRGGAYQGLGCFPAGTMVDTPVGPKAIETISVGDLVFNATGIGTVRDTMVRYSASLVRVRHEGGSFDCTPEHPILTTEGWVNALDLSSEHLLVSTDEAMQILQHGDTEVCHAPGVLFRNLQMEGAIPAEILPSLWKGVSSPVAREEEVLQSDLSGKELGKGLQAVREEIPTNGDTRSFLRQVLLSEMESKPAGDHGENAGGARQGEGRPENQPLAEEEQETHRRAETQDEELGSKNETRKDAAQDVSRGQLQHHLGPCSARPDMARCEAGSGTGRGSSSLRKTPGAGQAKGVRSGFLRVDRVEVLELRTGKRPGTGEDDHRVHNLEVEGHPSYSVNGVVVHNSMIGIKNKRVRLICDEAHLCPRVFVDAFSNLKKNPDFQGIALGNPKETTDALGVVCEPSAELGGWDGAIDQTPKTKTWPTRFAGGICLQLRGDDSPNHDVPEGAPVPYPFMITRKAMADDAAFYGEASLSYTMMNLGIMPRGQGLRRVITRQACLKFGAMDDAIWKNDQQTKIGFCDPAYGAIGGDRAVFGWLKFGEDPNGKQIIALMETMLIPVSALVAELPEDQIAMFVKSQCEQIGIPPQNFFFDSTGRGTLVGALARLWSPHVGLVEFGGKPTERVVSSDVRVTCRERYFNFVSELWFALSLTVQSGQFRGMTEEVINEGGMREWGFVGANRIQVEPKEKMKLKSGRSPDLVDAVVCGIEGARRLGFMITMSVAKSAVSHDDGWKNKFRDRMSRLEANHRLTY